MTRVYSIQALKSRTALLVWVPGTMWTFHEPGCAPASAEEGMWTFDNFPAAKMRAEYGWAPDQKWLDRVRNAREAALACPAHAASIAGVRSSRPLSADTARSRYGTYKSARVSCCIAFSPS